MQARCVMLNDGNEQSRCTAETHNVQLARKPDEQFMLEVTMPRLDESMNTGKLIEWLRKEGDRVKEGEPIAVVEGEKTTFEIEAPASGILHKTLRSAGSEVPVDEPIALIEIGTSDQHESTSGHA
jgi:pyruvate/2-oxoglutarate dehydrogenase complex dihydrolipoamide acyltransferase (E2) component